ncbi:hypothetical protein [Calothrix sp. 336/3]|uniref:hypothetical protein n=1 Tax=Calothrix sp. 336/3 TaxID=1337936 RepID=UPI0004E32711|nr:hypothetical protein [Calothrix sp. 336/3]AKG23549.1 hypothetical protein IJ00_21715 [Calothrix sp. 336/3]
MSQELPQIVPGLPPQVEDGFATHQTAYEFYQEVEIRLQLQRHSEWYHRTAKQHQQDLEKMRGEFNIMSWFRRK